MFKILKNPELKLVLLSLILFHIVFGTVFFLYQEYEKKQISQNIINEKIALAGILLSSNNSNINAKAVLDVFTKNASKEEFENGKKFLMQYGYNNEMYIFNDNSIQNVYVNKNIITIFFISIYLIALIFFVILQFSKIYNQINNVSFAAYKVISGDFSKTLTSNKEGDLGILQDNFNTMAQRLKLSFDKLHEDKVFLKNIISDISHQLKTPLSSLIVFNEHMQNFNSLDDSTKTNFISHSKIQLDRMEWLISSLLKMSRLESKTIEFKKENVILVNIVNKAVLYLKEKWTNRNIKINIIEESANINAILDEDWTIEAIENILKNAIEHSFDNNKINIYLSKNTLFSRIIIEDFGEGISKQDLPNIFKRFYRGNSNVKAESIGIGLSLSKVILATQDSLIEVKSEKNKGTQFILTFVNS